MIGLIKENMDHEDLNHQKQLEARDDESGRKRPILMQANDSNLLERLIYKAQQLPAEVSEWNTNGLPSDNLSTENGILVNRGRHWPLLIDPQGQANRWVRNIGRAWTSGFGVIKLSDPNFLRTLENGIRYGQYILLENVEEILDPALEPVLAKQIVKRQGQMVLRLGDRDIPYNEDFKFFITSKMPNPHYLPEICIKVTVINFTVTTKGLEDQLVSMVVGHERPELEQTRPQLVVQIAADKKQAESLEPLVLSVLEGAGEDLLADDQLIVTLDESTKTTNMFGAEKTLAEISDVGETPTRSSILYFVIADIGLVDPMYQYSLELFNRLFKDRLAKTEKNEDVKERAQIVVDDVTLSFCLNICRGLFEDHKLLYSFLNTVTIERQSEAVSQSEWHYFFRDQEAGKGVIDDVEWRAPIGYMDESNWRKFQVLENFTDRLGLNVFAGLCDDLSSSKAWALWFDDEHMLEKELPGKWRKQLNVLKSARESTVQDIIRKYLHALEDCHYCNLEGLDWPKNRRDRWRLLLRYFIKEKDIF